MGQLGGSRPCSHLLPLVLVSRTFWLERQEHRPHSRETGREQDRDTAAGEGEQSVQNQGEV